MMMVVVDADADMNRADVSTDHIGIGRARTQQGEGKQSSNYQFHGEFPNGMEAKRRQPR